MNKQQLLDRLYKAWEALKESYAGLLEDEMTVTGVMGDWSIKDIIAHVTWWEEEALKYLPVILRNEKPPRYSVMYGGIDAFNALMTKEKKDLPLGDVLHQRNETHRRLLGYIQNAPEDQFVRETRFRRRLKLDTYGHYEMHTEVIWKWRKQQTLK